ncbi:hypothetical protein ACP275_14G032500 [Erythranthe tilingii]
MESLVTEAGFVVDDDLLNFSLEGVCEGEEEPSNPAAAAATALCRAAPTGSFPEFVEEELEWLSNKDAFPAVETCFGILSDNPGLILNHQSPVSVLENNNSSISAGSNGGSSGGSIASCCNSIKVPTKYPVRARSKRRRRRRTGFTDLPSQQQCVWMNQVNVVVKNKKQESQLSLPPLPLAAAMTADSGGGGTAGGGMGRRCWHCQADKTPQWRAGPMGPKTLCNACGVRYKSGRLLPEYRPANSPTFSSNLHSNSHRKVVEMRRQKQAVVVPGEGIEVNVSCGYFG